ncbi:MAG: hypothetical protein M0R73_02330 [Dehalococcoidia bacterium]|nr:hypothetical protein [Dehalococcoidia bacterium]
MRIIRPRTQRDARSLKARLIPDTLSESQRRVVEQELRVANPHLDLDRLEPDSMIVVPDSVRVPDEVEVEEDAVERLRHASPETLHERIAPLRVRLQESIAREAEEREILRRDFRSRGVKAATDADPTIAEHVERVREQLTEDARDAREREARLDSLVTRAAADLEALQGRFG